MWYMNENKIKVGGGISRYELSPQMKRYINSYNGKYKVNDGNLIINRSVACTISTREGSSRADSSNYIGANMEENKNVSGIDLTNFRIRKLTPKECFRLMNFADEDFDKASKVNSNSQLYKQAGNSIVVNCLVAIIGQMISGKEDKYKEPIRW